MGTVTAQIVLRFAAASEGPQSADALLRPLGLSSDLEPSEALTQTVAAEAYYDLLERAAGLEDDALPLRYGASVRPEDYGAMGLALKTALTVREALERVARYIFVLSDTLEYGLREEAGRASFHLLGRPAHRRGSRLANEGALAALLSLLRQVATTDVDPVAVRFRHPAPATAEAHRAYFRCPVRFDADSDAVDFDEGTLARETRLGDEGLSAFLLARLEELRDQQTERTLAAQVRDAVTDALCDGVPSRDRIARRLGMSERTLHRRLADEGLTYRWLVNEARRGVAEALLAVPDHTLAEVAFLTGFSDQSAFSRAFKRWSGQTPGAFREAATG
jgi:AraC-like DNA-binding protein